MKKWYYTICLLVLATPVLIACPATWTVAHASSDVFTEGAMYAGPVADYYLDSSAMMGIGEVSSSGMDGAFAPNLKKHFGFGLSTNANWIRFKIGDVLGGARVFDQNLLIYFNYASFGDIRVFFPSGERGGDPFIIKKGGISHRPDHDALGFVFPVFSVPNETPHDQYVYIRIQGPFTSNFQLVLTDGESFRPAALRIVAFLSFIFGIIGAMILYNLVLFAQLGDKNYLRYVLYLVLMAIYQAAITGIAKIIHFPAADLLTHHVVLLCFLTISAHLLFAWSFLDVPRKAPSLKKFYFAAWAICVLGGLLTLLAKVYQANLVAYMGGLFLPILLVGTVVVSYRNGHWVSRYYLLAVAMLLTGVIIFAIRGFGLIEHSLYTSYGVLTTTALESLLFSFALADRVKRLWLRHMSLLERERELSRISVTDELTGLYNRRYYNLMLESAGSNARNENRPLSLMFIDIDQFKETNDFYGHQRGDQVLRHLGMILLEHVRGSDHPCRIGGDEFAVIMLDADLGSAKTVAERIRREFSKSVRFAVKISDFSCTVSIGLAQYEGSESIDQFADRADAALYRAKSGKRNLVVADKACGPGNT